MAKIQNWYTGKIIIEDANLSSIELLEKAVKERINLSEANLEGMIIDDGEGREYIIGEK